MYKYIHVCIYMCKYFVDLQCYIYISTHVVTCLNMLYNMYIYALYNINIYISYTIHTTHVL